MFSEVEGQSGGSSSTSMTKQGRAGQGVAAMRGLYEPQVLE